MLNITPKDKTYLQSFFIRNNNPSFEFVTFKSEKDRQFYHRELMLDKVIDEIFIRREYDGAETFVIIRESSEARSPFTEKEYRKQAAKANILISSDDVQEGGIEQ